MENLSILEELTFPELLKYCRQLLGMKQYACAEYLGFEHSRYKRIEMGRLHGPVESWEINRLQVFFKLPIGMLQKKQEKFLRKGPLNRATVGDGAWRRAEGTLGPGCRMGKKRKVNN